MEYSLRGSQVIQLFLKLIEINIMVMGMYVCMYVYVCIVMLCLFFIFFKLMKVLDLFSMFK